ncbi:MAG: aminoacyl-tRNA hydrolase [Bacilli bacterium]
MKLIVGLGNPLKKYDNTRHNVGFKTLDAYLGNVNYQEKFNALYLKKEVNNEQVIFIKPLTYMNLSGNAVSAFVNYFNIDIKDILIIQDDLDEVIGTYKLKTNSSHGGHNGIKSIIEHLGTKDFARLKVGINNGQVNDVIDFVLNKFSKDELNIIESEINIFKEIIDSFISYGIDKTMNAYNKK